MIKRFTKVTSLLVVAASVTSMVPAIASDVKTIEAQEGTVYQADAKGDGLFYIGGEINGEEAGYYVADNKYTAVDGIDVGDSVGKTYQNRYLEFNDGDYYLDYTTGEMTDDSIGDDVIDDAASAVRKNIKNDDDGRFTDDALEGIPTAEVKRAYAGDREVFFDGPFGTWSHYKYELEDTRLNGEDETTIYADTEGNYVDGDYSLGKLKVYSTGASVTIENTEDTYELEGSDGKTYELKAAIKENSVLTEGYADLYRTADLTIYAREKGSGNEYTPVTSEVTFGGKNGHKATDDKLNGDAVTVLEKFSKEQSSDDIDGIKYPKSTEIYFMTEDDGTDETLLALKSATASAHGVFTTSAKGITSAYIDSGNKKITAETVTLKSKNGYNYVDLGDQDDVDMDANAIGGGDVYVLSDGYVKVWDGDESFEKIYKVDGSMDNIVVSNQDNMVVWNEDDEVYSIIYNKASSEEGKDTTTETPATTTPAVTTGWAQAADGTWNYVKADGTKAAGWLKDGANWYYLKADGVMATGWVNDNGTWYYLNASGAMQTGWINDNGTWYYCNGSGAMLANTTVNGYVLGTSGAWAK